MIRISLAVAIILGIAFSLFAIKATTPPDAWFEVVDDGLIRIEASENLIGLCIGGLLHNRQSLSLEGQRPVNASYNQNLRLWHKRSLDGELVAPLRVVTIGQVDKQGNDIRIERWTGNEMPTLIILSYSGDGGPAVLSSQLASELARRGIRERS
jgi:hypothetical protein